ncbi:hypothetical protein [Thiomonas sp.]|uniref:hypothetical protein n=1 Tax=Thiomonas sp. TaxID=2047785 RepID=UPI00262DC294|nr:hypothetical protein [Thiomonas sp.]
MNLDDIILGEFAENELRKDFTVSERVAIAKAIEQRLAGRHGSNQHQRREVEDVENFPPPQNAKSRDLAAEKAGFGSGKPATPFFCSRALRPCLRP